MGAMRDCEAVELLELPELQKLSLIDCRHVTPVFTYVAKIRCPHLQLKNNHNQVPHLHPPLSHPHASRHRQLTHIQRCGLQIKYNVLQDGSQGTSHSTSSLDLNFASPSPASLQLLASSSSLRSLHLCHISTLTDDHLQAGTSATPCHPGLWLSLRCGGGSGKRC